MEKETLLERLRSLVPADSLLSARYGQPVQCPTSSVLINRNSRVEDVMPREKDGGAFVKFSYVPPTAPFAELGDGPEDLEARRQIEIKCKGIMEKEASDALAVRDIKPWFIFGPSRAFLVKVRLSDGAGSTAALLIGTNLSGKALDGGQCVQSRHSLVKCSRFGPQ